MKTKQFVLLMCVFVAGCVGAPATNRKPGECDLLRAQLIADPRIVAILAQKPLKDVLIQEVGEDIKIFVNSKEVQVRSDDGRECTVPGNMYTPQEVMAMERVALELRKEIGIQRVIIIHDESTGKEHRIFGAWWQL